MLTWTRANKLAVLLCLLTSLGCGSGGGGEADALVDLTVEDLNVDLGTPDVLPLDVPPVDLGADLGDVVEVVDLVEVVDAVDVVELVDLVVPPDVPDVADLAEVGDEITPCPEGYGGPGCDEPICALPCENGGTCTAPDTCTCDGCWKGATCAECAEDCACAGCGQACVAGECLFAACQGKACGDDGCGGSCGGCGWGEDCDASGQCVVVAWLDETTGLVWQVEPNGAYKWGAAVAHCDDLTLAGFSDWHMPDSRELRSLIRGCPATEVGGTCNAGELCQEPFMCGGGACECWNDTCLGCTPGSGPANGCYWPEQLKGPCDWYWSTFTSPLSDTYWLSVEFGAADVRNVGDDWSKMVRCVRSQFACEPLCNNGGFCSDTNTCTCDPCWTGPLCTECTADCACKTCGEVCLEGQCVYNACDGKQCGDDGCGGSCGQCAPGSTCDASGSCVAVTYADPVTGLYWELTPSSKTYYDINTAAGYCGALSLGGLSDWRIPTISELRSLVRGCPGIEASGGCDIADDCASWSCWNSSCSTCPTGQGPNAGCYWPLEITGTCGFIWSTTVNAEFGSPWYMDFRTGFMEPVGNSVEPAIICVHP